MAGKKESLSVADNVVKHSEDNFYWPYKHLLDTSSFVLFFSFLSCIQDYSQQNTDDKKSADQEEIHK